MVDIRSMLISIKAVWVKRLLRDNVANPYKEKWKNLSLLIRDISDKNLLLHKLSKDHLQKVSRSFMTTSCGSGIVFSLSTQAQYKKLRLKK